MAGTPDHYNLSAEEKAEYSAMFTRAYRLSNKYSGSEQAYEDISSSLIAVDEFARVRDPDHKDDDVQKNFARQAKLGLKFNTVSQLMENASKTRSMIERLESLKELLDVLKENGTYIEMNDSVFVLNDESLYSDNGSGEPKNITEFKRQPRLAILMNELQTIGVYNDDVVLRVGKVFDHTIRKLPYVVAEIPRIGKQVAVCDQYGEATFVSQNILHPNVWASATKKELAAMDGVEKVSFKGRWAFDVCNLLEYGNIQGPKLEDGSSATQQALKIDINDYMDGAHKVKFELTEEMIWRHMLLHLKDHKNDDGKHRFPTEGVGEVATLSGQNWKNWNRVLRRGSYGLDGGSSLTKLRDKCIVEQALCHHEQNGEFPTKNSGALKDYPYISWSMVEDGLMSGGGAYKTNLNDVFVRGDLKDGFSGVLSEDLILEHMLLHLKNDENHNFPSSSSGEILTLSGQNWRSWDAALIHGAEELQGGSSLSKFREKFIIEQALSYKKDEGELPTKHSGTLTNYPDITWDMLEQGLMNLGRARTSLERLFVKNDLKDGFDGTLTKDFIIGHMLEYLKNTPEHNFPSRNSGDVANVSGQTWNSWALALKYGRHGLKTKGSSLSKLREEFLIDQALLHQEENGELPTKDSGALKDYPDVTWDTIDQGLKNLGGRGRTTLDRLLVKNGLKNGFDGALSETLIMKHVLEYLKNDPDHNFPNKHSGDVASLSGQTWANLDGSLGKGLNGLDGGSSLPKLREEFLIDQALMHQEEDGELPTSDSGALKDFPDVTWEMIEQGLNNIRGRYQANLNELFEKNGLTLKSPHDDNALSL